MADTPDSRDASGFTLDLSTGKAPKRRKRTGPAPVVQQTINLSTPKPEASAETTEAPKPSSTRRTTNKGKPRKERRAPRGNSLADLVDPETLARLRGDGGA